MIASLRRSYQSSKIRLEEENRGLYTMKPENRRRDIFNVEYIENRVKLLPLNYRTIIYETIILGKEDKWHKGLISKSKYYRDRLNAYKEFIRLLS